MVYTCGIPFWRNITTVLIARGMRDWVAELELTGNGALVGTIKRCSCFNLDMKLFRETPFACCFDQLLSRDVFFFTYFPDNYMSCALMPWVL
ncbi:unnamed protein product [Ectocarpus sp. 8 AP-2014]